jgi:hypothetical protein
VAGASGDSNSAVRGVLSGQGVSPGVLRPQTVPELLHGGHRAEGCQVQESVPEPAEQVGCTGTLEKEYAHAKAKTASPNVNDELNLFTRPVALGSGMSIFKELDGTQKFVLEPSRAFSCGIVLIKYYKAV